MNWVTQHFHRWDKAVLLFCLWKLHQRVRAKCVIQPLAADWTMLMSESVCWTKPWQTNQNRASLWGSLIPDCLSFSLDRSGRWHLFIPTPRNDPVARWDEPALPVLPRDLCTGSLRPQPAAVHCQGRRLQHSPPAMSVSVSSFSLNAFKLCLTGIWCVHNHTFTLVHLLASLTIQSTFDLGMQSNITCPLLLDEIDDNTNLSIQVKPKESSSDLFKERKQRLRSKCAYCIYSASKWFVSFSNWFQSYI